MRIGKNMFNVLTFARAYPGWHTYIKDRATKNAVERLRKLGLIRINGFGQFQAIDQE